MQAPKADLSGTINLLSAAGRKEPIPQTYWGHGNLPGSDRYDSCVINLEERKQLLPGESCTATLRFKFSHLDAFNLTVRKGDALEMREGSRLIGSFEIEEVLNEALSGG